MNKTKGFTLIELLVVIAIIGILSSVVLASLNTARGKGSDAAIKSQLAAIRPQAEIYYDTNGNYGAAAAATSNGQCVVSGTMFAADSTIANQIAGVKNTSGATQVICGTNANPATAWAISARLVSNTGQYWCVDSTGASKQESAAITGSACQ
ncbi:MAG TPA: type II secretion system protein [Candidatus Paceibacterota bacterium]|nr:type II secretion system protein [Candidatus Paceibacterota bacterium]